MRAQLLYIYIYFSKLGTFQIGVFVFFDLGRLPRDGGGGANWIYATLCFPVRGEPIGSILLLIFRRGGYSKFVSLTPRGPL